MSSATAGDIELRSMSDVNNDDRSPTGVEGRYDYVDIGEESSNHVITGQPITCMCLLPPEV